MYILLGRAQALIKNAERASRSVAQFDARRIAIEKVRILVSQQYGYYSNGAIQQFTCGNRQRTSIAF